MQLYMCAVLLDIKAVHLKSICLMEEDKILLIAQCSVCGERFPIVVNETDWERWNDRENPIAIQKCFPYLTAAERELFLSGLCDDCYHHICSE